MNVNRILIREKLTHGDLTEIAKKTGSSRNTVYSYFNGRTRKFRRDFTEIALQILEERAMYSKKFEQHLD